MAQLKRVRNPRVPGGMTSPEPGLEETLNAAVLAHGSLGTREAYNAAVGVVVGHLASVRGLRVLSSTVVQTPAEGRIPAAADVVVLVYLGAGDVDAALRITLPYAVWFGADHLTGYSGNQLDFAAELGLMQLRRMAPGAACAIARSHEEAEYLQGFLGFSNVVEVGAAVDGRSDLVERLRSAVSTWEAAATRFSIQVQGPFDSTYSLAVVNAGIALSLDRAPGVWASLDVAPGDQVEPDGQEMIRQPRLDRLWRRSLLTPAPDAVIRNSYPPLPEGIQSGGRFLYFFWEDSLIPAEWAARFNRNLTGVLVPSRHVRAALQDSGVSVPVGIVPCGVNTSAPRIFGLDFDLPTSKGFRFLHVSSAFPRKGIDVLLEAYAQEFTAHDDVTLVLKTFPNPHNTVAAQVASMAARHPAPPEVVHIDRDLPDYAYYGLFRACDAFVSTTRCEGFGLPMVEAMLFELPVIVTAYSGQMDFCSDATALLVSASLVPSESHLGVPGAMWAEPSIEDTRRHMRAVFESTMDGESRIRTATALDLALGLTWDSAADQAVRFVRSIMEAL